MRSGSAADLVDLAATDRAGALEGRLAVLHRDVLGVLDFDLLLVLDAVSLCHISFSSLGKPRHESTPLGSASRWARWRSLRGPERRAPSRRPGHCLLAVDLREDPEALQPRIDHGGFRPIPDVALGKLAGPTVRVHGAHDAGTTATEPGQHEHRRGFHLEVEDALADHLVREVRVTDGKLC